MDYSHDPENPAGASPWGSPATSPQHTRTTFTSTATDNPPPAFGGGFTSQTSSNGLAHESDEGGFGVGAHEHEYRRPDTASTVSTSNADANDDARTEVGTESGAVSGAGQQEGQKGARLSGETSVQPGQEGSQGQAQSQSRQPQFRLQAKITALERAGRKDPILRFDVHTNLPRFRTTQYRDVRRLHSEFEKLAEHLISANPEAFVPAVPPAVTSAGAGTDEDEARVKAMMQRWCNYVCGNNVLMGDEEMVLFVESDFGYSPMVKKKQPATGVKRKYLKQFQPPPDDTPELANSRPVVKLFYLGSMDAGHKVDRLVKSRRGLGLAESDFGVKLGSMNVQELHQGLANAYRKLGKVVQTVGDCHAAQATAEATTLGDPFEYHSSDAFIVKETLTNRQLLIREFNLAQNESRSKLSATDRLKASSNVRREKVDEAIAALDEARHNEDYLGKKTARVTQNLVQEGRKWFARTAADLRLSIREYVIREIEAERRTLALLESVRPDIRSIDGSGGLSRLGREAHPTVRRSNLAASQGPKGDAWSGVPRRSDNMNRSIAGSFMGNVADEAEAEEGQGSVQGRPRGLSGVNDEDDEDRVDARNAASRLATSTF